MLPIRFVKQPFLHIKYFVQCHKIYCLILFKLNIFNLMRKASFYLDIFTKRILNFL